MPEPLVSVVIPARNEAELIGAALRSVAEQSVAGEVEAVVVSNGSDDGTADVARAADAELAGRRVRVIEDPIAGVARAKNLGVAAAGAAILVFLDGDSRMSPGLLAVVAARARAGERIASVRVIADGSDAIDHAFFWVVEHGKRLVRTHANMFWCERAMFEQLGGFDETLNHAEDLDLLVRARRAGARVGHIRGEWIATSPRRLHRGPLRIGMFGMLGRWTLGHLGVGRRWPY